MQKNFRSLLHETSQKIFPPIQFPETWTSRTENGNTIWTCSLTLSYPHYINQQFHSADQKWFFVSTKSGTSKKIAYEQCAKEMLDVVAQILESKKNYDCHTTFQQLNHFKFQTSQDTTIAERKRDHFAFVAVNFQLDVRNNNFACAAVVFFNAVNTQKEYLFLTSLSRVQTCIESARFAQICYYHEVSRRVLKRLGFQKIKCFNILKKFDTRTHVPSLLTLLQTKLQKSFDVSPATTFQNDKPFSPEQISFVVNCVEAIRLLRLS